MTIRINVNGPAHVGIDHPGLWEADRGSGGICGPNTFRNDNPINGTPDDPLFHGEMFGNPLVCRVGANLPPGPYQVALFFAEVYWGPGCPGQGPGTGSRVFDVFLENREVLSNFDIFREGGGCAANPNGGRPVIKRFMVNINDGTLDLRAPASVDNGKLSAIEIRSAW